MTHALQTIAKMMMGVDEIFAWMVTEIYRKVESDEIKISEMKLEATVDKKVGSFCCS